MIKVNKTTKIPRAFVEYSQSKDASFDNMTKQAKDALRKSLLEEQKFICAYCNCSLKNDPLKTKIEHFKPQSTYPDLQLQYSNLFVCCLGIHKNDTEQTCDTRKGNSSLKYSPIENKISQIIKYEETTGKIESTEEDFSDQLNDVLNLNFKILVSNRKTVLDTLRSNLKSKGKANIDFRRIRDNLIQKDNLQGYIGIVLAYLNKKIN
ncbi:TIGR02646 family protein [Pseudoalteromonas sp. SCSIO 43088]|uniref:retron system putative HNH endonuclease n=1 Tax=Pseudoalteromonas sp. SCSIO 43088 TaxID=2822846 RepID=UPI00202B14D7|nr:retron system putative HNH endonuclease [Pseudoalteromonas sp. SCSIO 43088]URQ87457.1 TIGR02646 family protein [Pseudoalteromonas sp. SCSIO 43088]